MTRKTPSTWETTAAKRQVLLQILTWWGSHELRHSVALHEFRHVQADHRILRPKVLLCQRLGQLCLANTSGTREQHGRNGALGVLQPNAGPAYSTGNGTDGVVLQEKTADKTLAGSRNSLLRTLMLRPREAFWSKMDPFLENKLVGRSR
jgi:hypothetical protein